MSGRFYRARFVRLDVRGLRCKHSLMRTQCGGNDGNIRLCAANQKMYRRIGSFAFLFYHVSGIFAVRIVSVACGLLKICRRKTVHYLRQRTLEIVAFKSYHDFLTSTLTLSPTAESFMRAIFSPLRSIIFSAIASSTSFCIVLRRLRAP